jgi:hypothetical protein
VGTADIALMPCYYYYSSLLLFSCESRKNEIIA